MKRTVLFSIFLASALGWARSIGQGNLELGIVPGTPLRLELTSGNYQIEAGQSGKVVIVSQTKNPDDRGKVRFGVNTSSAEASVKITGPKQYSARIQIPQNINLNIRLNGGKLTISSIDGDKDIESNGGQLNIGVRRPEDYGAVDASVNVGNVDASAFGGTKAGLLRTFRTQGPGRYRLHVHLGAGNINLLTGPEM
jgi:hypothetical protein